MFENTALLVTLASLFIGGISQFQLPESPLSKSGFRESFNIGPFQSAQRGQNPESSHINADRLSATRPNRARNAKRCTVGKSRVEITVDNNSQATLVFYRRYKARKTGQRAQETLGTVPPTSSRLFRVRMRTGINRYIYAPFCTITPVAALDGSHAVVTKRVREKVPRRGTCRKVLREQFTEASFTPAGFTCDVVIGAPFQITALDHATELSPDSLSKALFIDFSGPLEFPVEINMVPRSCPVSAGCDTRSHLLLAGPPAGDPLVFPTALHCPAGLSAPASFEYEVAVTDSRSRESNPLLVTYSCIP